MSTDLQVAPEWVALAKVPEWLRRRFDLRVDPSVQEIISAVRNGTVVHRVAGLEDDLDLFVPDMSIHLPQGIEGANDPVRAIVTDWDKVTPDWSAGTVKARGGRHSGAAHTIELHWPSVECWFNRQAGRTAESVSGPASGGNKGGRPPKHNWDNFWIEVAHWTAENDLTPARERRPALRRHMLEWTVQFHEAPDATAIDRKLAALFKSKGRLE